MPLLWLSKHESVEHFLQTTTPLPYTRVHVKVGAEEPSTIVWHPTTKQRPLQVYGRPNEEESEIRHSQPLSPYLQHGYQHRSEVVKLQPKPLATEKELEQRVL